MKDNVIRDASAAATTELKATRNSMGQLSGRLIQAQDEEKVHIGKELHDDICQSLAVIGYKLDRLLETLPAAAQAKVLGISESIRQLTEDINRLSNQLYSLTLKDLGLAVALRTLCASLADNRGIKVQFRYTPISAALDYRVSLTLYRVAQEALSNIRQHSRASHASVELLREANEILLRISDDGVGFDPAFSLIANGIGLASTEERLKSIGGSLLLRSRPGQGTVVEARSPSVACTQY
jgi:signal transduction histidine kinase